MEDVSGKEEGERGFIALSWPGIVEKEGVQTLLQSSWPSLTYSCGQSRSTKPNIGRIKIFRAKRTLATTKTSEKQH